MFIHQSSSVFCLFEKASKNVLFSSFGIFDTNMVPYHGFSMIPTFLVPIILVFKILIIGSNSADNVTSSGEGWVELHLKIYSLVQGNVLWNFGTGEPDPKAGPRMVLLKTLVVWTEVHLKMLSVPNVSWYSKYVTS